MLAPSMPSPSPTTTTSPCDQSRERDSACGGDIQVNRGGAVDNIGMGDRGGIEGGIGAHEVGRGGREESGR